jgi:hypothetical protein
MSALPPKADIHCDSRNVSFGPLADILRCSKERHYSITLSAMVRLFSEQAFKNFGETFLEANYAAVIVEDA